jgi:CHAT domain-containing protein
MIDDPTILFDIPPAALPAWLADHSDELTTETVKTFKLRAQELANAGNLNAALKTLERGMIIAKATSDPLAETLIWRGRANVLQRHERLEEALQASQRDADHCERYGNPFDVALARTIQVYILGALGQYEQAIDTAHWIRPHYKKADFIRGQAHLAMNLAQVYTMAWELHKALDEYEIALDLYQEMKRPLKVARVHHNQGVTYELLGDIDRAQIHYERAYPTFLEARDVFMLVKTQYNLAMLAIRRGSFEQALSHLDQARIDLASLPDSPDSAYVNWFEAWVRKELGQETAAIALIEEALETFHHAGYRMDTAQAHLELSELLANYGDGAHIAQALDHLDRAKTVLGTQPPPLLNAWINLKQAEHLLDLERHTEALNYAQTSRDTFQEAHLPMRLAQSEVVLADILGETNPCYATELYQSALEHAEETLPLLTARCWRGIGHLATVEGDYHSAEHAYENAYETLDHLRHTLYTHRHQAGFLENRQAVANAILELFNEQTYHKGRLLTWVERFKASALADLLSNAPPDRQSSNTLESLLGKRRILRREWDQQIAALKMDQDTDLVYDLQQAPTMRRQSEQRQLDGLNETQRTLQKIEEHIAQERAPGWAWRQAHTLRSEEIQELLDSDTVLLSYYTVGEALHVLTVTHQASEVHSCVLPTSLTQIEQRWRFIYRQILQGEKPEARLSDLWQKLIGPLEADIQAKTRLLISPCRGLFNLPFTALYDPQNQRYLVERWCVQILPSATILDCCRRQQTGSRPPLLIGYPGQPDQPDYLSNVRKEIVSLRKRLPSAKTLFGEDATYDNVLAFMPQRKLVHIASHAHYHASDPLESGISLAERRQLRANDLYQRRGHLQGTTVVLSACNSSRGHPTGWDILGLNSAFLYAGAVGIIGGLWPIDDDRTASFMTTFYRHLLEGQETARALRQAQLAFLADKTPPYYWAPFMLYGDSRTVFSPPASSNPVTR